MKLVWTYDSEVNTPINSLSGWDVGYVENRKKIILNYYLHSINTAKNLGYETVIYCNPLSVKYFEGMVDEIFTIEKYENTPLWDGIKTYPLEIRNDEYCLIDGDIILHQRLPEFKKDIVFDVWEIGNWEKDYKETVLKLDSIGIGEMIPEWSPERTFVANSGFMWLQNKEFRDLYVNRWKTFNNFIIENVDVLNTFQASLIAGQMMFSLLIKKYGYEHDTMSKHMDDKNPYYTHFFGGRKFKYPITKYNDYIDKCDGKSKILI